MFWIAIIIIIAIFSITDLIGKWIKSRERTKKYDIELLQEQVKLEQLKYDTYLLETEKLKLTLQKDLQDAPSKEELLQFHSQKRYFAGKTTPSTKKLPTYTSLEVFLRLNRIYPMFFRRLDRIMTAIQIKAFNERFSQGIRLNNIVDYEFRC